MNQSDSEPKPVWLPYPLTSADELPKWYEGVCKHRKELREELAYWKENSGYWQDSAVLMGSALLAIGDALGVDIHASSVLVEATDCIGAPDHE